VNSDANKIDNFQFSRELEQELTENILPFWMKNVVDPQGGGFYGALGNDRTVHNGEERSAVLCARILWTFAAAYRKYGRHEYLEMARRAHDYLVRVFWDNEYGGLFWSVDQKGAPVRHEKYHYTQAFGIYGLSEYYRAGGEARSLALAQELFQLLEKNAFDKTGLGYFEASSRDWKPLGEAHFFRLRFHKSTNAMLHILEAYTNLLRVSDDALLAAQHRRLLEVFHASLVDHASGHFRLYFDSALKSLDPVVSFGHDIEGSWLLVEAAIVQGDPGLVRRTNEIAVKIASAVLREGVDGDGSLFEERAPEGLVNTDKIWWAQAEAVVGFYNAFKLTNDFRFAQASLRAWRYIQDKMVDKINGEWFKHVRQDGTPYLDRYKTGPWECPYHNSRMCLEMMERLAT
jgi:mannobiose 2-epimerase